MALRDAHEMGPAEAAGPWLLFFLCAAKPQAMGSLWYGGSAGASSSRLLVERNQ
jgi:hypothetical protein